MVKRTITISTIFIIIILVMTLLVFNNRASLAADDDIASGTSGTCSWVIDSEGVLTISPTNGVSGVLRSYTKLTSGGAPWNGNRTQITKVNVEEGVSTNEGCWHLFYELKNCTQMNLSALNTSNATDMEEMFFLCTKLTELDLTSFDTSNVTTMQRMFANCYKLTTLNISSFNTNNVTDMKEFLSSCSSLSSLNYNLNTFKTNNVTDMSWMFYSCSNLTQLDVTKFDTSSATSLHDMFASCSNLTSLDVTNFNTGNVTDMSRMFSGCSGLTQLDVTHFNTSNVTNMSRMFNGCSGLTELDVTNFNTSNVTDMQYMFSLCANLTELDLSNFNTSSVTNMHSMFVECTKLIELDLSNFNTSNVTDMNGMVYGCSALSKLDLSGFNTNNVTDMAKMFNFSPNIKEVNLGKDFSFDGKGGLATKARLTNPSGEQYTGKWIRKDGTYGPYTSEELSNNYDGTYMSGTWIWERATIFYSVKYSYYGDIPDECSELPADAEYEAGSQVVVAENAVAPGYTFSGWSITGTFEMPTNDVEITGYFIPEEVAQKYTIEYYFDEELDDSLTELLNAMVDVEVSATPEKTVTHGNYHYVLVSANHSMIITSNEEENVIRVYYEKDTLGWTYDKEGDGIPDKYQILVKYRVQNGTWNDGTTEDIIDIIALQDSDGNYSEIGKGKTTIPEVGENPNEGYHTGKWNNTTPDIVSKEDDGKIFTYEYEKEAPTIKELLQSKSHFTNPKTDDQIQNYLIYIIAGLSVLVLSIKLYKRYSRKMKKIQF